MICGHCSLVKFPQGKNNIQTEIRKGFFLFDLAVRDVFMACPPPWGEIVVSGTMRGFPSCTCLILLPIDDQRSPLQNKLWQASNIPVAGGL